MPPPGSLPAAAPSLERVDRWWIVGPPGSGKSTVAEAVATRMGVAATHLDDLHWLPGWRERPDDEFVALVSEVVARDRWVIDGNYTRVRRRFTDRAQLVVWLDLPLCVCVPRLLRRCVNRALYRTVCCNGNTERLWPLLLPREENLLCWAVTTDRRRRRDLSRELAFRRSVRLRSASAAKRWLRAEAEAAPT